MKGAVKAKTVDKYLSPIRQQIIDLIAADTRVLEVGSGTGDLLIKLSPKINHGVGLDISAALTEYAQYKSQENQISNLNFQTIDVTTDPMPDQHFDYAVASLVLHILPWNLAEELLIKLVQHSDHLILAGFCKPQGLKDRFLLWLDQRFNKHYPNFKQHLNKGGIDQLLKQIGYSDFQKLDTFDASIKLYVLSTSSKI